MIANYSIASMLRLEDGMILTLCIWYKMADTHGSSSCHQGHLTPGEVYPVATSLSPPGSKNRTSHD